MKTCTFFGHYKIEITDDLKHLLHTKIESLILDGFSTFLFGGLSEFDDLCYKIVSLLKTKYSHIERVFCFYNEKDLAKPPKWTKDLEYDRFTYFPLSFNWWYKRIYFRNCEMILNSDYVIFYVSHEENSGAYKALKFAKQNKKEYSNVAKSV